MYASDQFPIKSFEKVCQLSVMWNNLCQDDFIRRAYLCVNEEYNCNTSQLFHTRCNDERVRIVWVNEEYSTITRRFLGVSFKLG
mmetsp:Transcript_11509/g.28349  ORF Transcript_11509/g.28349 Transcript_11509/m.28349 type:complete len:84 (+) Transcript_11509:73-324(+)